MAIVCQQENLWCFSVCNDICCFGVTATANDAYSNEEKLSIITRYQQGESAIALSNELAIPRSTLYRWFNSFPTDSSGKPLKFSYQEYALLQRKVEKLQNIIIILKSVDCLVSAPLKERLHALEPFYGKYEVHTICEALDVDRGTFYNHMLRSKRGNAWFDKRRQEYCQLIRDVFDEYRQVLGAEKIRTIRSNPFLSPASRMITRSQNHSSHR